MQSAYQSKQHDIIAARVYSLALVTEGLCGKYPQALRLSCPMFSSCLSQIINALGHTSSGDVKD
jgi:hypothetical protein